MNLYGGLLIISRLKWFTLIYSCNFSFFNLNFFDTNKLLRNLNYFKQIIYKQR
ncbi:hypothetical protein NUSPORA_02397 [Nucleospora cyclopteri]